jgi:hypothetical protein
MRAEKRTVRKAKTSNPSECVILEGDTRVGFLRKTHDPTGKQCFGVFFDGKRPMYFMSKPTAKAVAEYYQDSDF